MSAIGSAPRGRESLVREDLTQIIVIDRHVGLDLSQINTIDRHVGLSLS